jgi:glycosyltransferase involved in cell wall biosynthesis
MVMRTSKNHLQKKARGKFGKISRVESAEKTGQNAKVKISVVVPAFNEERLLGKSLAQIKSAAGAFLQRQWEFELIVCDNNSTDRTAEIARAAGAKVVFEPVNQIARARNSGAAAATGDWLIFVDADSGPGAELFSEVAEQIFSGNCLAGGCTLRLDEHYLPAEIITGLWNHASRLLKLLAGSFIFCDAAAFRKIGGFDNELFAAEELELSKRLKKLARETGKRIVILHRHPLVTSARKMKLYSKREHLRFFLRAMFNQRRTLTSREEAHLWYDGRR